VQVNNNWPHPPGFFVNIHSDADKVLCFDALLQVFILNGLFAPKLCKVQPVSQVRQTKQLGQPAAPESKNAS
jgi:hypothetical protein